MAQNIAKFFPPATGDLNPRPCCGIITEAEAPARSGLLEWVVARIIATSL